jgi:hypothetical protein
MTPDEHRDEAERLIGVLEDGLEGDTLRSADQLVAIAQVHATLATYRPPSPGTKQLQDENRVLRIQNSTLRSAIRDLAPRTVTPADTRPKPGPPPNGGVRR